MTGAIIHEWVEPIGGAERVVDAMMSTFPNADLWCLWNDAPERFPGRKIHESPLARSRLRRHKALALPWMPRIWRMLESDKQLDWMLVSSHLFAHHAHFRSIGSQKISRTNPEPRKYVYSYTPARYLWRPDLDERGRNPIVKVAGSLLKPLDRRRAKEAYSIAAISKYIQARIEEAWDLPSIVIYPPVDVERIESVADWASQVPATDMDTLEALPDAFILGASRFVPYKRLDLIIQIGEALGLPVVIAGQGPEEDRLRSYASTVNVPIHFIISPSDALLFSLYQRASVFVFPVVEDFGIMPVEAMAAGCPVVGLLSGGTGETIINGVTGVLAETPNISDLVVAVNKALLLPRGNGKAIVHNYGNDRFSLELENWIKSDE